ncbi:MAG: helix-turn-helix transcriptional regulator [Brevundimonas sp.]
MSSSRTIAWDVSALTLPDAFDRYLVGMADLYEVSGVSDHDRLNFYNVTRSTLGPAGAVGFGRSVRQTLARGPAVLRRSDIDGLNMVINRRAVVGDCDGRAVRAAPGALQFRDMSRPSASRFDAVDLMTILTPRHLVPARLLTPGSHGLVLPPDAPGVRLIDAHMTALVELADALTEVELATATQALLLLAARVAGDEVAIEGSELEALQGVVRRTAADYIENRVRSLDLPIPVDAVARASGVSRATLYRAFDGEGGVTRFIQDRRLHHARTVLARRRGGGPSIADVSHQYGFASPGHFSRLFRARYDYSPSELGSPEAPPDVSMTTGPIRHDLLADWLTDLGLR